MCDLDLSAAMGFHRASRADATLVLYRHPEPLEYGLALTDDTGPVSYTHLDVYKRQMPVGNDASTELLLTPEQRTQMYRRIRAFRQTKSIFAIDFQNDGEYIGGCIAGGRHYLHINANGDVEPCVFIHYSNCNIHECTLLEALQSPLFMAYHDNQPFNQNHLRPCPMLRCV